MLFSTKLRELRKQKKWSQSDLAKKLNIHGRQIGKYENGQVMPNAETLVNISKIFDVSLDYLLLDKKEKSPLDKFDDPELMKYFTELTRINERDKEIVKSLIDAYLKKTKLEAIMS